MKLSCSDFTGGWASAPLGLEEERDPEEATPRAWLPSAPEIAVAVPYDPEPAPPPVPSTPSADALAGALEPLFDRTDEIPALPFLLDTPVETHGLVTVSS